MKPQSHLQFFKKLFILPILALFIVTSCQDEIVEVTLPNNQDTIGANSNLSNLLSSVSSLNGSLDDIIDNASCFAIALPVTIEINGSVFVVNSEDDYEIIINIFEEFSDDDDSLEIQFPITIILNDYTTLEITNQSELEVLVDECLNDEELDDAIECVDFQYPIVFSVYNSNFQVTETVTIQDDEALYNFIEDLDGGILASLNFPVTLILSDGSTIEVNNNVELEAVIEAVGDTCDDDDMNEDDDCAIETINGNIVECIWSVASYTGNDDLSVFTFEFNSDGSVLISDNGNYVDGNWEVSETNEGLVITFSNISASVIELMLGEWQIVECDDDDLELAQNQDTLILERDCSPETFGCFESFNEELIGCDDDNDGFAQFDLDAAYANCNPNGEFYITYHETLVDAEIGAYAITSPYTNMTNPTTLYVRVELVNNPYQFEIFELELILENCNPTTCSETDLTNYLQECDWNVVNFNGSDDLIIYDLEFQINNTLVITGNGETLTTTYTVTQDANGVYLEFDNVSGPNIQAITGIWHIIDCDTERLEMTMGDNTMVMERDCN
ncbi:hypothetical protein ES676_08835 [Bizionia saleffrena]|uniref:Lipocalin-like domain-containing protein n=1 Tax=Bizionia saleffrena TaxID=291189 RepID=A0A8H2QE84_9FLAO|nr:hypothetical protein [Bizionia saleffrena]TYB73838.1 hypothetical protein ES676_08835 [Bizionia saleffrena]